MENKPAIYLKLLKIILGVYIVLAFLIAGLNYGYARSAPQDIASFINWIWLIYENGIKAGFILIGSFLSIKIIGSSKRTTMRKLNLVGFIVSALAVHIIIPLVVNNYDLYFYTMPFPWTTTPLQLLDPVSSLHLTTLNSWGTNGISSSLVFFVAISLVVFIGTLLFGRRLQCSSICMFNGFAAEVFDPAIPLIGKRKNVKGGTLRVLKVVRWLFLGVALFFIAYWVMYLLGISITPDITFISRLESYKYLVGELLLALFFWIAFIGRGYCYYCPLGTVLSGVSRIAGQKITTNNTKCIRCNKCNEICPMTIDVKSKAINGESVQNNRCVGCGHCVDECPTKTLAYSTHLMKFYRNKKNTTEILDDEEKPIFYN